MLARLAILGFAFAAVAVFLDRGVLWELTLEPERRLMLTAYWALHALLIAGILVWGRSLIRSDGPTSLTVFALLGIAALAAVVFGLLIADAVALVQVIFAERSFGALAIIVGLLIVHMIWRVFRDPGRLTPVRVDASGEEVAPTWGDTIRTIVMVPVAFAGLLALYASTITTWRMASLFLDVTAFDRDPATLDWSHPFDYVGWYFSNWQVIAFLAGVMVIWILLEALFVRPKRPEGRVND